MLHFSFSPVFRPVKSVFIICLPLPVSSFQQLARLDNRSSSRNTHTIQIQRLWFSEARALRLGASVSGSGFVHLGKEVRYIYIYLEGLFSSIHVKVV